MEIKVEATVSPESIRVSLNVDGKNMDLSVEENRSIAIATFASAMQMICSVYSKNENKR